MSICLSLGSLDEIGDLVGGVGDLGAWTEDQSSSVGFQVVVVFGWDHSSSDQYDVLTALLHQLLFERRYQRLVSGSEAAGAHNVHIVVDRLSGNFFRRREERANIYLKAK